MRQISLVLICVLVFSCKPGKGKEATSTGKPKTEIRDSNNITKPKIYDESNNFKLDYIKVDTSIRKDLTEYNFSKEIKNNLKRWLDHFKDLSSEFNIDRFKNYNTRILNPYQVTLEDSVFEKRFFDLYKPYLIWSPDSSKVIDLYSYRIVLDYDSKGDVYAFEDVDCQLALIDLNKRKFIIIETLGPMNELQDAFWLDNESIIVTMTEDNIPYYSMINLNTFLERIYKSDSDFKFTNDQYIKTIFKDVRFE
jgi:hypothetical protein